jgi:hypothetical protein
MEVTLFVTHQVQQRPPLSSAARGMHYGCTCVQQNTPVASKSSSSALEEKHAI